MKNVSQHATTKTPCLDLHRFNDQFLSRSLHYIQNSRFMKLLSIYYMYYIGTFGYFKLECYFNIAYNPWACVKLCRLSLIVTIRWISRVFFILVERHNTRFLSNIKQLFITFYYKNVFWKNDIYQLKKCFALLQSFIKLKVKDYCKGQ